MWLINVSTFKLESFLQDDVWAKYPYAILSHTWEGDEVTHQDMRDLRIARHKAGFWKIQMTCEQAKEADIEYAWVDTCCIDKTSSAELQEAVNSMFEWYARASECYAYLADVKQADPLDDRLSDNIQNSRWFSRGWTLQELIAPANVYFFDKDWSSLGSRRTLATPICTRTGIDAGLIENGVLYESDWDVWRFGLGRYSIAQRMSWAADRETSREEDRAYSLLGIFGVAMPLLYGEGKRAFTRLQEEIIRTSRSTQPDLSILLWEDPRARHHSGTSRGDSDCLLASSPNAFRGCRNIAFYETPNATEAITNVTISSSGLRAQIRFLRVRSFDNDHESRT